jgi:hypothetical protein
LMNQENNAIANLLRPLLEKEDMWELFRYLRGMLLHDYFLNMPKLADLWLFHQVEKEDSVFHYRLTVLQYLRAVDTFIGLDDLNASLMTEASKVGDYNDHALQLFSRTSEDNMEAIIRLKNDRMIYPNVHAALNAM